MGLGVASLISRQFYDGHWRLRYCPATACRAISRRAGRDADAFWPVSIVADDGDTLALREMGEGRREISPRVSTAGSSEISRRCPRDS